MRQRGLSLILVWSSFYEQLAWSPVLVLLAAATGDVGVVALAASAYSLANLLGNLAFGLLADRMGRYRVAGTGLVGMAATAVLHVMAATPAMLVGARFLHGLAAAMVAPAALAVVSDGAAPGRRGEAMARVGLVIALASMASPVVTGRLARGVGVSPTILLLAGGLALVGLVTLVAGWGLADPSRQHDEAQASEPAEPESVTEPTRLDPGLTLIGAVVAFALMFGQNVLFYALPLRGAELGMNSAQVGGVLSAFALGSIAAFVPPLSRTADRLGRRAPLLLGLTLTSAGLLGLSAATSGPLMAVSLLGYGFGFGLVFPAVSAISADAAGRRRRGQAFGVLTAAFSAGAIAGPLLARSLDLYLSPFGVAAIMAMCGMAAIGLAYRPGRPATPPLGPGA